MLTDKATIVEKAAAWDHLMADTSGNDSAALQRAWERLCETVKNRKES